MFRQGLRRCARPAGPLSSAATMARPRAAVAFARLSAAPTSIRSVTPMSRLAAMSRSYSSETIAPEVSATDDAPQPPQGDVVRFEDLASLGVHPKLIESITKGLKYETMTPVQAKTINPALKGTDM